jgi:hypothetical protein
MEKSLTIKVIQILSAILLLIAMITTIGTCNKEKEDPIKDRLEEINDSLMHEMMENSIKIDSLYDKIDSLDLLSDTIINKQPIVNEYYRQEVYNILNTDARGANRKLAEVLKVSDSLLKAGFFSRTIDIPNELN